MNEDDAEEGRTIVSAENSNNADFFRGMMADKNKDFGWGFLEVWGRTDVDVYEFTSARWKDMYQCDGRVTCETIFATAASKIPDGALYHAFRAVFLVSSFARAATARAEGEKVLECDSYRATAVFLSKARGEGKSVGTCKGSATLFNSAYRVRFGGRRFTSVTGRDCVCDGEVVVVRDHAGSGYSTDVECGCA